MNIPTLKPRNLCNQISQIEPEEFLVIDARYGLSPAQRVEQKLLDLLGGGHPGLLHQATGRLANVRLRGQ